MIVGSTNYRDETMSTGITVRVYPVSDDIVWRMIPAHEPKPKVPVHEMETKTGAQKRIAKEGDPEWAAYQHQLEDWQECQDQLRNDARLVACLDGEQKDFALPEKVTPGDLPFITRIAIEDGQLEWPEYRIGQYALWLKSYVVKSQDDMEKVLNASYLAGGMDEGLVEAMRDRFRRDLRSGLLGEVARAENQVQPVLPEGEVGPEGRPD